MQSEFLKINWLDLGKGVLVAILTVVLQGVIDILQTGLLPSLQQIYAFLGPGLAAGLAYVLKNLFTNSQNQLGKSESFLK